MDQEFFTFSQLKQPLQHSWYFFRLIHLQAAKVIHPVQFLSPFHEACMHDITIYTYRESHFLLFSYVISHRFWCEVTLLVIQPVWIFLVGLCSITNRSLQDSSGYLRDEKNIPIKYVHSAYSTQTFAKRIFPSINRAARNVHYSSYLLKVRGIFWLTICVDHRLMPQSDW
jgi:hypothetical protein